MVNDESIWDVHDIVQVIMKNTDHRVRQVCTLWCELSPKPIFPFFFSRIKLAIASSLGMYEYAFNKAKYLDQRTIREAYKFARWTHKHRTAKMLRSFLPKTKKIMRHKLYDTDHSYPVAENTVLWYFLNRGSSCGSRHQFSSFFNSIPYSFSVQDPIAYMKKCLNDYDSTKSGFRQPFFYFM